MKKKQIAFLISFIMSSFFLISCDIFFAPAQLVSSDGIFLSFDQDIVIEQLMQNNSNALIAVEGPYPGDNAILDDYVKWSFEDYLFIAETSHRLLWSEGLDDWQLLLVNMDWDCDHFEEGPQEAIWEFMKFVETERGTTRFDSVVLIEPRKNFVNARSEEYFPPGGNWKPIDLSQLHISLFGALRIAENNGGSEYRKSVENMCDISVTLNTTLAQFGGWIVDYKVLDQDTITYYVDPATGEIEN